MSKQASPTESKFSLEVPIKSSSLDVSRASKLTIKSPRETRRNREALRNFYSLPKANAEVAPVPESANDDTFVSCFNELDADNHDVELYAQSILETKSLDELLNWEFKLQSEIRELESNRKALVYDNYSKLINASDTIRKMRSNTNLHLSESLSGLPDTIERIIETASSVFNALKLFMCENSQATGMKSEEKSNSTSFNHRDAEISLSNRIKCLLWVQDTPRRLKSLIKELRWAEASRDWNEIQDVISEWKGIKDLDEFVRTCESIVNVEINNR